jgi:hypothetical protein
VEGLGDFATKDIDVEWLVVDKDNIRGFEKIKNAQYDRLVNQMFTEFDPRIKINKQHNSDSLVYQMNQETQRPLTTQEIHELYDKVFGDGLKKTVYPPHTRQQEIIKERKDHREKNNNSRLLINLENDNQIERTLINLQCHDTGLKILPQLPPKLSKLVCLNNSFTMLPDLPPKLSVLYCSHNSLESLPKLPSSLTMLYCDDNKIQIIPELPSRLNTIELDNNKLIEPFLSYYTTYRRNGDIAQLKESVNNYYADIKRRGRNESMLRQTFGIQENIGRRRGESAPNQPNIAASLPANTLSVVSSFLTGKNGPQYRNSQRNKPTQLEQLKSMIGYRNARKTRKTRKH